MAELGSVKLMIRLCGMKNLTNLLGTAITHKNNKISKNKANGELNKYIESYKG